MEKDNLEKASSFLPEAWYDLIVRLVPGAIISTATLTKASVVSSQFEKLDGIVLGVFISYAVGFFIDSASDYIVPTVWSWFRKVCVRKVCVGGNTGNAASRGTSKSFWEIRSRLKPHQWQVISKMTAEANMFKSFAGYSLLQVVLCLLGWLPSSIIGRKSLEILLVLRTLPLGLSLLLSAICILFWRRQLESADSRLATYVSGARKILKANILRDSISLTLNDGSTVSLPLSWYPRLESKLLELKNHEQQTTQSNIIQPSIIQGGQVLSWPGIENIRVDLEPILRASP